ncbi:hypothetical protein ACLOJK_034761, partial [Asimina triloba]
MQIRRLLLPHVRKQYAPSPIKLGEHPIMTAASSSPLQMARSQQPTASKGSPDSVRASHSNVNSRPKI